MPDNDEILFNNAQRELAAAIRQASDAHEHVSALKEQLGRIQRELANFTRFNAVSNREPTPAHKKLIDAEAQVRKDLDEAIKKRITDKSIVGTRLTDFAVFTDPRKQIGKLDDKYPVLLMPVRLETRFKQITERERAVHQLWIRIYPDECAVDSFEATLSEMEVENAIIYWQKIWEAGEDENRERGAWRSLVQSHGSGRAAYIISQFKPASFSQRLKRNSPEEIILVSNGVVPAIQQEADELEKYWKGSWTNFGDAVEEKKLRDAIVNVLGSQRAGELIEKYMPSNFLAVPPTGKKRTEVLVRLSYLDLPAADSVQTKQQSWSQAPKVHIMPDRFVLIGYRNGQEVFNEMTLPIPVPLAVGPDPSATEGEAFKKDANGDMVVEDELKWMTDFDAAIAKGMGIKITLNADQLAAGFDRIIALGVRMSTDHTGGQALLEELIDHHHKSRKGFSIIKQGTPSNNTEGDTSGYLQADDADESYDDLKKGKLFDIETDDILKTDGQWLSEALGVRHERLQQVNNSDHTDHKESICMNIALWPATMGYMMDTMMHPVFSDADIEFTRTFFNRFVTGRGRIPAVRIGKQPYGIFPATAFSRLEWPTTLTRPTGTTIMLPAATQGNAYLARLYTILKTIDADWKSLSGKLAHVYKNSGDPHQDMLDAVGLHASSLEYYQRTAQSAEDLSNRLKFKGKGKKFQTTAANYTKSGMDLLRKFGYKGAEVPDLLTKFFLATENLLKGPVIDDRPLSEKEQIRKYTSEPNAQNYIEWLIDAVATSHDTLRRQEGFLEDKIPTALLYLLLHHSLDLGYIEVSIRLHRDAQLLNDAEMKMAKKEPAFLHIKKNTQQTESRWKYLYSNEVAITKDEGLSVGEYIPQVLKTEVASAYLGEQLDALQELKHLSTAALERLFSEHIDCCAYRLDAWKTGITNFQLAQMRQNVNDGETPYRQGIYIGAYGWLENVRSSGKNLVPLRTNDEQLHDIFIKDQAVVPVTDSTNGGFILAPSLNQAVTASVLRSAYQTNNNPDALRVNLSSERVRKALAVIEGIRGGQPLGALLGYYLERGLHEGYPGLELDYFIYQLRKAFPLTANKNSDTKMDDTAVKEAEVVEARNVVDGLALIDHIKTSKQENYPFGKSFLENVDDQAQANAINAEVKKIMDINDALADLALAESVHQVTQGNYDRGASTLDSFSKGNFPPIPDFIQTPRSGTNITHRVGLHFEQGLSPAGGTTPRSQAEPGMNKWLKSVFPPLAKIICHVSYKTVVDEEVSLADLKLEEIDVLYTLDTESSQAMMQIDDLLIKYVMDKGGIRPDAPITIDYMKRVDGKFSFFEITPLIRSLRNILLKSRPLVASDVALPDPKKTTPADLVFLDPQRVALRYTRLDNLWKNELKNYINAIDPLVADVVANKAALLINAEKFSNDILPVLTEMAKSGMDQSGFGFVFDRKKALFTSVTKKASELIERWEAKKLRHTTLMTDYGNLPAATPEQERFELLEKARSEISTKAPTTLTTATSYEQDVLLLEPLFTARLLKYKDLRDTAATSISTLIAEAQVIADVSSFDLTVFPINDLEKEVILWVEELAQKAKSLYASLEDKLKKAKILLDESALLSNSKKVVDKLLEVAKLLFHEDFKIIPEFRLPAANGEEWSNSYNNKIQLLQHVVSGGNDQPMDTWLYGVGRVREKMQHWENIVILTEAFGKSELVLQPLQLPHKATDTWLGLEVPAGYTAESDRLLYTAHYSVAFDKTKNQCGLLLDEWTELIPALKETAGVAFHFDRPSSEPPQVMLLALPTAFRGGWQWQDLLDAVTETMDAAKMRAVEPAMINELSYGRVLPALLSSMTTYPVTAALNLSFNNMLHEVLLNQQP